VQANVCLVDAANFTRVAAFLKPAVTQVRCADAIVLNKTDLVNQEELRRLRAVIKELNPRAVLTETQFGKLPVGFLEDIEHRRADDVLFDEPPADIVAVSIGGPDVFDRNVFYDVTNSVRNHLLRLKGHIRFQDGLRFVEMAGTSFEESDPVNGYAGGTALTAIGWKIDKQTLKNRLLSSMAS
jgi:G3E family GTPase